MYRYDTTGVQAVRRLSTVYSDDVLRCEETDDDDDDEMTSLLLQLRHEHQRRQQAENQLRRVQVRLSICLSVCQLPLTIRYDITSLMCG